MSKFKSGDRVICIDNSYSYTRKAGIKVGGIYTVKKYNGSLSLQDYAFAHYPSSFERAILKINNIEEEQEFLSTSKSAQ